MGGLHELLAEQAADWGSRDTAFASYKESLVGDKAWEGWWGLWHFRDRVFYSVYFRQEGRVVKADWLSSLGVREGFEGQLSDSGLLLEGLRVGEVRDGKCDGKFISPLSMALARDGGSITASWDWHLLYPVGTEPKRLTPGVPEIFAVHCGDAEFDSIRSGLRGPFAAVRREVTATRYSPNGVATTMRLDAAAGAPVDGGVDEEPGCDVKDPAAPAPSVTSPSKVAYSVVYRELHGEGTAEVTLPTVREVATWLVTGGYHSVWRWTPGADDEILAALDALPALFALYRTPRAAAEEEPGPRPVPSEDILEPAAIVDRIHHLKYVGAPLMALTKEEEALLQPPAVPEGAAAAAAAGENPAA